MVAQVGVRFSTTDSVATKKEAPKAVLLIAQSVLIFSNHP